MKADLEILEQAARRMLGATSFEGKIELEAVIGGANNRIFKVGTEKQSYLLKAYYRHHTDSRDRRSTEFLFAKFLWGNGIRAIPEPIAEDAALNLALFEFVEGRRLAPAEVTAAHVIQAVEFLKAIAKRSVAILSN